MKLGAGAALTLAVGCLESCSSSTAPTEIDFTIDLNQDQFKSLNTNGSYLIYNGVVISKGIDGAFYAATVICSHENEKKFCTISLRINIYVLLMEQHLI